MANLEQQLVDQWLKRGQHARVVRYVATRSRVLPRLYLYRAGIRAATVIADHEHLERFADEARAHFPESPLGFVEGARLLLRRDEPNAARRLIQAVDGSETSDSELRSVATDVENALSNLSGGGRAPNGEPTGLEALRDAYKAAARADRWEDARRWADKAIAQYPGVAFGPIAVAHALRRLGNPQAAKRMLLGLPDGGPIERSLLLAELVRAERDDLCAMRTLTAAQRHHAADKRLLMRLADLYRDDGQRERAHVYYKAATRVNPEYGTIRRLTFESDVGWLDLGAVSLTEALALPPERLLRFMHIVNRVSPFYPEQTEALSVARAAVRKELWRRPRASQRDFDGAVDLALKNRWLSDVRELCVEGEKRGVRPSMALDKRVRQITEALAEQADLVEVAWHNEHAAQLMARTSTGFAPLTAEQAAAPSTIELFIPTPFFAFDDTEKPTYDVVRRTLRHVARHLLAREDVAIVPRVQLNWRHASRRLSARAISYHTHAARDAHWLHVQEAPLYGRCSFDDEGFAGFASIAHDFSRIEEGSKAASPAELEAAYERLRKHYVESNTSKYKQATSNAKLPERFVFVPMQVSTDIVAELAFIEGQALVEHVAEHFAGTDTQVVVKRHPYCRSFRIQRMLERLVADGRIVVTQNSVHDLLSRARCVITVNSGVGLEALLHDCPVIATGRCEYAYAAHVVTSADQLRARLEHLPPAKREESRRFLWFYDRHYLVDADDQEAIAARVDGWLSS